ncbi:MAG: glycosyltransferase [Puniceicoccaceae bacterium]
MGNSAIGLVRNQTDGDTNSFHDFREFEEAILQDPEVEPIERSYLVRQFSSLVFRIQRRLGRRFGLKPPYHLRYGAKQSARLAILSGPSFRRCTDYILRGRKAAYLYDPTHPWVTPEQVVTFVEDVGLEILFVPHPTFRDRLQAVLPACKVCFIPEAANPEDYSCDAEKTIDILAFGRSLIPYHNALDAGLSSSITYKHGRIEEREDLKKAMAAARIILNFPRSITAKTTDVEMLTMRYFQTIASKALILGHCPALMRELFGYDPVVEADLENPFEQVEQILANFNDYQDLIERNYETFINGHTFQHRWQQMKQILLESQ